MTNKKISFESTFDPEQKANSGLKLSNKRSKASVKKEEVSSFKEAVEDFQSEYEGYMQEALDLGKKFIKILDDQTLPENKSELKKSFEKEVLEKLDILVSNLNNNHQLPEGEGSGLALKLTLSAILKIRDKINKINYELHLLKDNEQK